MADPTANYSWDLPNENLDPWYTAFDTMVSAIDTSVRSVETFAVGINRGTLVLSLHVGASLTLNGSTTLPSPQDSHIFSANPFGRAVGSFAIVASGTNAWVTLDMRYKSLNSLTTYWRTVINPGSLVCPSNSHWVARMDQVQINESITFRAVQSLGQGNYNLELQVRAFAATGSAFSFDTDGWVFCTVTEQHRGV
jgi:hypothetical protein